MRLPSFWLFWWLGVVLAVLLVGGPALGNQQAVASTPALATAFESWVMGIIAVLVAGSVVGLLRLTIMVHKVALEVTFLSARTDTLEKQREADRKESKAGRSKLWNAVRYVAGRMSVNMHTPVDGLPPVEGDDE
jgi:outer membrane murein-binding lipoprotein Lpp